MGSFVEVRAVRASSLLFSCCLASLMLSPDLLKDPKNGPPNMNPLLHWGN